MPEYFNIPVNPSPLKKRSNNRIWTLAGVLVIFAILIVTAYALTIAIPEEQIYEKQAEHCRQGMEKIKTEADKYILKYNSFPPEGKLDKKHLLVTEGYLEEPLRCPSTDHYYTIEYNNGQVSVICDSKFNGHELK